MIWPKRNKELNRYYLFAGMGGRSARRKQNLFLAWALAAAVLVSVTLAVIFYVINNHRIG